MKDILSLCSASGMNDPEIIRLKGDMSERKIFRVKNGVRSLIAVSSQNIAENNAFLSFRDTFESNGLNVPGLVSVSDDKSVYLLEDLGDQTVRSYCEARISNNDLTSVKKIYRDLIAKLAEINSVLYDKIDYSKCYQGDTFGRPAMEKDITRFSEYFLKKYHGNFDPDKFRKYTDTILSEADLQDKTYFMYRDFQSRNIMLRDEELFFIDFQSGRRGSFYYDLASFIFSSGTFPYEGMEDELSEAYFDLYHIPGTNLEGFRMQLKIFGCLRIMQALGNYAFYYYTRSAAEIKNKKKTGLENLIKLSLSLDLETGIIPDISP